MAKKRSRFPKNKLEGVGDFTWSGEIRRWKAKGKLNPEEGTIVFCHRSFAPTGPREMTSVLLDWRSADDGFGGVILLPQSASHYEAYLLSGTRNPVLLCRGGEARRDETDIILYA